MSTGLHRILLPPVLPGRAMSKSIEGECTTCGLVKRYPGSAHGARKRIAKASSTALSITALPPVVEDDAADHAVAFDALCHLGNGTAAEFARVAGQVEGSALFADVLLRTLELQGHIDVRRHPASRAVEEFEMTPPTLVALGASTWWFVGRTPRALVDAVREAVDGFGGAFEESLDQGVPRRVLTRCSPEALADALTQDPLGEVRLVTGVAEVWLPACPL